VVFVTVCAIEVRTLHNNFPWSVSLGFHYLAYQRAQHLGPRPNKLGPPWIAHFSDFSIYAACRRNSPNNKFPEITTMTSYMYTTPAVSDW